MMPHPRRIRNQRINHPKKGSTIAVDPIRNLDDIEAIEQLLYSKPRDYLLFVMGVSNWLRVGDLLKLKAGLFRNVREDDKIKLREENTGKLQIVVINKEVKKALDRYFAHFKPDDDQFLFFSTKVRWKPITSSRMNALVKQWCKEIGLRGNYGALSLRKTFGYIQHRVYKVTLEKISMALNQPTLAYTISYLGIQDNEVDEMQIKRPTEDDPIIQIIKRRGGEQRKIKYEDVIIMSSRIRNYMREAFEIYMQSEEWQAVTEEVKKRDKWKCRDCGITEKEDEVVWNVHHESYLNFGKANDEEIDDCILLCSSCHTKRHSGLDKEGRIPFWAKRKYNPRYMAGNIGHKLLHKDRYE